MYVNSYNDIIIMTCVYYTAFICIKRLCKLFLICVQPMCIFELQNKTASAQMCILTVELKIKQHLLKLI